MNRIYLVQLGNFNDRVNIEVWFERIIILTDLVSLIGLVTVGRETIFSGVYADSAYAQLGGCPQDSYGDFTAVGDEDFVDISAHESIPIDSLY